MVTSTYRLVTFGELALYETDSGRRVSVPRKALAVMAILASSGTKPVSRERVMSLLWQGNADAARGALKQTIYSLRQTLGTREIIRGGADLVLDPAMVTSDVGEFEALLAREEWTRAIELHAGVFLDGFHARDAVEFEQWTDSLRARCRERFHHALEKAASAARDRGDALAAVALSRRLAADDPLSATAAVAVMDALAASGDHTAALRHFSIHERLMREELGAAPHASVVAAAERAGSPPAPGSAGRAGAAPTAVEAPAAAAAAQRLPSPAMAERRAGSSIRWVGAFVAVLLTVFATAIWARRPSLAMTGSIPLPANAASRVAVDPNLDRIFVTGGADFDQSIVMIDPRNHVTRTVPHGAGIGIDSITHWYWSGDYGRKFVVVRSGRTEAEIGRVSTMGCPFSFATDAKWIWVAQQCDDHISVIDSRTRRAIRHIPMPTLSRAEVGGAKGMGEILANGATSTVYFSKDMIPHRLDPRTWEIRETPGFGGPVLAVHAQSNRLYARIDNGLRVIDGATEKAIIDVPLRSTPGGVAVGFGGRRLYAVTSAALFELDGRENRVLTSIALPEGFAPHGIAVHDGRREVYVAGSEAGGKRALKIFRLSD